MLGHSLVLGGLGLQASVQAARVVHIQLHALALHTAEQLHEVEFELQQVTRTDPKHHRLEFVEQPASQDDIHSRVVQVGRVVDVDLRPTLSLLPAVLTEHLVQLGLTIRCRVIDPHLRESLEAVPCPAFCLGARIKQVGHDARIEHAALQTLQVSQPRAVKREQVERCVMEHPRASEEERILDQRTVLLSVKDVSNVPVTELHQPDIEAGTVNVQARCLCVHGDRVRSLA